MGKDSDEIANKIKYQDYDDRFSTYVYNSETGQVFGRTGVAWAKLIIFYLIFYAGLAAFAGLYYFLFNLTLSEDEPKWQLDKSLIGTNPGMGYRPMPDPYENAESTLIWYKRNSTTDAKFWYKQLDDYVYLVENPVDIVDTVNPPSSLNCGYNNTKKATKSQSCRVDINEFGPCNRQNKFGYPTGEPCILLKLNKIFSFEPEGFGIEEDGKYNRALLEEELNNQVKVYGMPEDLKKTITRELQTKHQNHKEKFLSTIWISCEGEGVTDKENVGTIAYFPQPGIPGFYFPYYKQKGYQSPFIFIQLTRPLPGVLINVECKAWARNIKHDRVNRLGSVHFEIMID